MKSYLREREKWSSSEGKIHIVRQEVLISSVVVQGMKRLK